MSILSPETCNLLIHQFGICVGSAGSRLNNALFNVKTFSGDTRPPHRLSRYQNWMSSTLISSSFTTTSSDPSDQSLVILH